jgi:hypothetical protein
VCCVVFMCLVVLVESVELVLLVGVSTPGVPGPTSKLSLRVPAQMGRRETGHKGETASFVLSCAQGGWMRLQ